MADIVSAAGQAISGSDSGGAAINSDSLSAANEPVAVYCNRASRNNRISSNSNQRKTKNIANDCDDNSWRRHSISPLANRDGALHNPGIRNKGQQLLLRLGQGGHGQADLASGEGMLGVSLSPATSSPLKPSLSSPMVPRVTLQKLAAESGNRKEAPASGRESGAGRESEFHGYHAVAWTVVPSANTEVPTPTRTSALISPFLLSERNWKWFWSIFLPSSTVIALYVFYLLRWRRR